MQLTVFELPTAVAEASLQANPMKGVTFIKEDDKIPEEFANQEEDDGEWQPKGKQPDHPYEADYAEKRKQTHVLRRFIPPAFRIVGYDPKSKRKVSLGVEPQAAVEVSGGVFSPYFDPEKRRELAKIICDALILNFPSGRPFELMVPWSGAKNFSTAEVEKDAKKISTRSGAERVVKRPGRLFRAAVRISKYELIVSMYQHSSEISGITQLIFNFYSPAVSEAAEITVDEDQQIDRIGAPILSFLEGSIRTAAIRRFCRFFGAEIIVDILDPTVKTLHVVLLPPNKDFVTEYQISGVSEPGENIRPVGYPGIFFPLDTCGKPLHRRGMTLENRDKKSETPTKEFLVTVYTKSELENPERGLVIKFYDRGTSLTSILHVGPSELIRLCDLVDEPDLLRDIVTAQEEEVGWKVDDIEAGFKEFTEKGQLEKKTQTLHNILIDIILKDLGFFISPQETVVPYFKTAPRGIFPE